jgi:hypothetical protein
MTIGARHTATLPIPPVGKRVHMSGRSAPVPLSPMGPGHAESTPCEGRRSRALVERFRRRRGVRHPADRPHVGARFGIAPSSGRDPVAGSGLPSGRTVPLIEESGRLLRRWGEPAKVRRLPVLKRNLRGEGFGQSLLAERNSRGREPLPSTDIDIIAYSRFTQWPKQTNRQQRLRKGIIVT